ncbi:hypothetical protein [Streptomyces osmaniensis]|uniref:Uncharacterized protein n=1 Tax=Streptomyces osmaniensis TaxID=593134 RepID=A0ABP6XQ95_9ACTN|nr:hypothetical protein KJK32_23735 [Streptomyces sp. JCM17656]
MNSMLDTTAAEIEAAVRQLGTAPDTYGPTLNTGVSVEAVERVGRALADQLRQHEPTVIAFWSTSDEAVLGHVVARELGADLVRVNEAEGVVSFSRSIPSGARVVLLATAWTKPSRLEALVSMSRAAAAEPAAVASVLGSPRHSVDEVPNVSLLPQAAVDDKRATGSQGEGA